MSTHNEFDADDPADAGNIDGIGTMSGRIAEALTPLAMPATRTAQLQQRLTARVAQSVERHRGWHTVRQSDLAWQTLGNGVRACVLHDHGTSRSALLELAAGASLPSHRHATHEESIVLRGSLHADDSRVGLHDYHLAPAGSKHGRIQSTEGALAFLRGTSIGKTNDMLREMAEAARPEEGPSPTTVVASTEGWREVADGAFIKSLWLDGASASMLLRLEAGARMPAQQQSVEAEYLMLSGEAFSDVGALFYVHGDEAYTRLAHAR
jgi:quercetin dioxygenase-like cupin family protein